MILPSESVYEIVQLSEKRFQLQIKIDSKISNLKMRIVHDVVKQLSSKLNLFRPAHPVSGYLTEAVHEVQIIKAIASQYVGMRLKTRAKKGN